MPTEPLLALSSLSNEEIARLTILEFPEEMLTLENLRLTPSGQLVIRSLSKEQRKALYDLMTIFVLTFYDKQERAAAERMRELIRKNTLDQQNGCEFDKTEEDRKAEEFKKRLTTLRPK